MTGFQVSHLAITIILGRVATFGQIKKILDAICLRNRALRDQKNHKIKQFDFLHHGFKRQMLI